MQFYDQNKDPIGDAQEIEEGQDATAPKTGYDTTNSEGKYFAGWDKPYTNVTEDLDIYPVYMAGEMMTLHDGMHDSSTYSESPVLYEVQTAMPSLEAPGNGYNAGWFHSSSGSDPTNFTPVTEVTAEDPTVENANHYVSGQYLILPLSMYYDDESEIAENSEAYLICTKNPSFYEEPYAYYLAEEDNGTGRIELIYTNQDHMFKGIPMENWTFTIDTSTDPEHSLEDNILDVSGKDIAQYLKECETPPKFVSASGKAPPEVSDDPEPLG